jgi:NCS1 family nucleobase:cation symporter-1
MITDYYIVRKGYLNIKALYSARTSDAYYYSYGFSWRAYAAYLSGIMVNIVGFAGAVGRNVPVGAQYIYNVNYFSGVIVSGIVYVALTWFWPVAETSDTWNEVDVDEVAGLYVDYGRDLEDLEGMGMGGERDGDLKGDQKVRASSLKG